MSTTDDRVHVVMARPDAKPDELRQLADALELVEEYLATSNIDGNNADHSMTAHLLHEMLWRWGTGKHAQWNAFDVERFYGLFEEHLVGDEARNTIVKCACHFFDWLGGTGARVAPVTSIDLQRRITAIHHLHKSRAQ